jgi:hypothetical protein
MSLFINALPHRSDSQAKQRTTISWVSFTIDTQGENTYTLPIKKGDLINDLNLV